MNQPVSWARRITFWLHRIKVKSALKMRGKPMTRKREPVCMQTSEAICTQDRPQHWRPVYTTQDQGSGCKPELKVCGVEDEESYIVTLPTT